jgi:hypothetical protein
VTLGASQMYMCVSMQARTSKYMDAYLSECLSASHLRALAFRRGILLSARHACPKFLGQALSGPTRLCVLLWFEAP